MRSGNESTAQLVKSVLDALREKFPNASEDEIFEHFVLMARQDQQLQTAVLSDEEIAAKVFEATQRLARN